MSVRWVTLWVRPPLVCVLSLEDNLRWILACCLLRFEAFLRYRAHLLAMAFMADPFLLVGANNLLSGRVGSAQTDYYSYEFVLRKLEARV